MPLRIPLIISWCVILNSLPGNSRVAMTAALEWVCMTASAPAFQKKKPVFPRHSVGMWVCVCVKALDLEWYFLYGGYIYIYIVFCCRSLYRHIITLVCGGSKQCGPLISKCLRSTSPTLRNVIYPTGIQAPSHDKPPFLPTWPCSSVPAFTFS